MFHCIYNHDRRRADLQIQEGLTMNIKQSLIDFMVVFAITLIVTVMVTFLWNFLVHAKALVDWETSFRFAIIFGIVLPVVKVRENMNTEK